MSSVSVFLLVLICGTEAAAGGYTHDPSTTQSLQQSDGSSNQQSAKLDGYSTGHSSNPGGYAGSLPSSLPASFNPLAPAQVPQPPLPSKEPRPLNDYIQLLADAIVRKFKDKRENIERKQGPIERQLYGMFKTICDQHLGDTWRANETKFKQSLHDLNNVVFGDAEQSAPVHPLIQSDFIFLWSNVNIYYAMNYILSDYCTAFDEFAVVTVIKQLTVYVDKNLSKADDFVQIIKAIWDRLFADGSGQGKAQWLKAVVLNYANKNVASYSLKTLAITHMQYDVGIFQTLLRLLEEENATGSYVKLATYNCVIKRFYKIVLKRGCKIDFSKVVTVTWNIWRAVQRELLRLKGISGRRGAKEWVPAARFWEHCMLSLCKKFRLRQLESDVENFFNLY